MGESVCFRFRRLAAVMLREKGAPMTRQEHITLAHGAGGQMTARLIREVFADAFHNETLARLNDAAVLSLPHGEGRLAFSTDGHVVQPLFFPGGDIGELAVFGTVNDLAMMGARPLWLAASFIIEAGFPVADLRRVAESMARAAARAGVQLVAGDTKVVEKGKADGLYISVAGVGWIPAGVTVEAGQASPGDVVLVNAPIAAHGMAVMLQREGLHLESDLESDAAPLNEIVMALLDAAPHTHTLRDATRGGLATVLHEIARAAGVGILLREADVPVNPAAADACALLGLDPLYVANEGVFVAFVPPAEAEAALVALHAHPLGRQARAVGEVLAEPVGQVVLETRLGARRLLPPLGGNLLPRIC